MMLYNLLISIGLCIGLKIYLQHEVLQFVILKTVSASSLVQMSLGFWMQIWKSFWAANSMWTTNVTTLRLVVLIIANYSNSF